jgi:putative heme-binding domain-containing protein
LSTVIHRFCAAGVARHGGALRLASIQDAALNGLLQKHIQHSLALASDEQANAADRARAFGSLEWLSWPEVEDLVATALSTRSPTEVQIAALQLVAKLDDANAARQVLSNWPELGPQARAVALETLCSRSSYALALLDAVEQGEFEPRQLDSARISMLMKHADADVRDRATTLLAKMKPSERNSVLENYRGALELAGDATRGREAFRKTCAACHRLEGVGYELGPNLAAMKARGAEAILVNVIDPNREANPQFINYVVTTTDGRSVTGLMAAETATSITLRRGEGAEDAVLRTEIDEISATGLSLMPEGLEQQLDQQALADVIAYVLQVE